MKVQNLFLGFIASMFLLYFLYLAQSLIIPFVIALFIWYIIISTKTAIQTIRIAKIKIPDWIATTLALIIFILVAWIFITFINSTLADVLKSAPDYQNKFQILVNKIINHWPVAQEVNLKKMLSWLNLSNIATTTASLLTSIASFTGMIFIYVVFLLLEYKTFKIKFINLFKERKTKKEAVKLMVHISQDVNTYLKIKTFTSLLTAVLSYLVLITFGIQFAPFWALLVFILNYIPNIGSLIAVTLPIIFAIIQIGNFYTILFLLLTLFVIQFIIGNIVEPKLMGKSLNLSPLVILISLVIWGNIWGVVGMFLSVPIMVIINIILSYFPSTKSIAMLLSTQGKIEKTKP